MSVKNKDVNVENKSNDTVTASKTGGNHASLLRKVIAVMITFVAMILLVAETYTYVTWFVPWISIHIFQITGIAVADGLTFSEFSVGDTVVMIMMWLLPSLAMVGITTACQWVFIKWVVRKLKKICTNAFFRKYTNDINTNNKTL